MENLNLDILAIQETYVNTNSIEQKNGYTFLFSTSVDNKDREAAEKQRLTNKGRGKGKKKSRGRHADGIRRNTQTELTPLANASQDHDISMDSPFAPDSGLQITLHNSQKQIQNISLTQELENMIDSSPATQQFTQQADNSTGNTYELQKDFVMQTSSHTQSLENTIDSTPRSNRRKTKRQIAKEEKCSGGPPIPSSFHLD